MASFISPGSFAAPIINTPFISLLSSSVWSIAATSASSFSELSPFREPSVLGSFLSISSINKIQGFTLMAASSAARNLSSFNPLNPELLISLSSKKGTPMADAMYRARTLLPVPGGPTRIHPWGNSSPPTSSICANSVQNAFSASGMATMSSS